MEKMTKSKVALLLIVVMLFPTFLSSMQVQAGNATYPALQINPSSTVTEGDTVEFWSSNIDDALILTFFRVETITDFWYEFELVSIILTLL